MEVEQMSERQPERDVPGTVPPAIPEGPSPVDQSELSRYDLLLASIPLALLCAALFGHLTPVPLWASLSVGALASLSMVVDGVALHPPV
jgi:hypothetical protein